MDAWFVRKEDGMVYGPAGMDTLREWAAAARIEPSDSLSQDQETWQPASDEPGLEMNWLVELEEGGAYGPVHVCALLELAADGTLPGATQVRNARDGRRVSLRALALIEGGAFVSRPVAAKAADPGEGVAAMPPSWQSMARERDRFQKESDRWQERYEREISAAEATLHTLQSTLRTLEEETSGLRSELDRSRSREELLRRQIERRAEGGSTPGEMDAAFLEMAQGFETLAAQLADKSEELGALRQTLTRTQTSYTERIAFLETEIDSERKEARAVREELTRSEEAYREVIQSLRELNFRYIQLKETRPEAVRSVPAEATEGVSDPKPVTGSRLRLTR